MEDGDCVSRNMHPLYSWHHADPVGKQFGSSEKVHWPHGGALAPVPIIDRSPSLLSLHRITRGH